MSHPVREDGCSICFCVRDVVRALEGAGWRGGRKVKGERREERGGREKKKEESESLFACAIKMNAVTLPRTTVAAVSRTRQKKETLRQKERKKGKGRGDVPLTGSKHEIGAQLLDIARFEHL